MVSVSPVRKYGWDLVDVRKLNTTKNKDNSVDTKDPKTRRNSGPKD